MKDGTHTLLNRQQNVRKDEGERNHTSTSMSCLAFRASLAQTFSLDAVAFDGDNLEIEERCEAMSVYPFQIIIRKYTNRHHKGKNDRRPCSFFVEVVLDCA